MTLSRTSIAVFFSLILLFPIIVGEHQEQEIEEKKYGANELTDFQVNALTDARNSGVGIGWEKQVQSISAGYDQGEGIVVDSTGNAFVTGVFCSSSGFTLGSTTLNKIGICDMFLAKMSPTGYWYWAIQIGGQDSRTISQYHTISLASDGGAFLSGYSNASSLTLGSISVQNPHSPANTVFLAKASSSGEWLWAQMVGGQENTYSKSVQSTSDGGVVVAGLFYSSSISFDSYSIFNTNTSQSEIFVAKSDADGNWLWASSAGGTEWDGAQDLAFSSGGELYVVGDYSDQVQFGEHTLSSTTQNSVFISTISVTNGTWISAIGLDSTNYVRITGITGSSDGSITITGNFIGSLDFDSTTLDSANNESLDLFVAKLNLDGSWNWAVSAGGHENDCAFDIVSGAHGRSIIVGHFMSTSISFGNTYISNTNQWDANWDLYVAWLDSDGNWEGAVGAAGSDMDKLKAVDIHTNGMVYVTGRTNSTSLEIGLDERSTSGYEDMFVALLDVDSDGDEIGDGRDSFPTDSTQQSDRDYDGYGDNPWGYNGDKFPDDYTQHEDSDGDGYGDNQYGNNPDKCPSDSTQWLDNDGDGYCDSSWGNNPDAFPNDATQWRDSDGDGYGDNQNGNNPDKCPSDSTQWLDNDGDGYCDSSWGNNPDAFPNDATQWRDSDGDGYGDNPSGMYPDDFPNDSTQYSDSDWDGYGDSPYGNNPDAFRNDSTQWSDLDDDGYGDNPNGFNGDLCLGTSSDEKRYVDENGCGASQRDTDNDGVVDSLDSCDDTEDLSTANLEGCDVYQRDFDGDGLVDALDPCPDSVENLCLEAVVGAGEMESSTEARLLWGSFGLLLFIATLLLIMMFRKGKGGNSPPTIISKLPEWK